MVFSLLSITNLIDHTVSSILSNTALNSLPYAEGASWDPARTCLPNTRVELLDDIWNWINSANNAEIPKLFWLTSVAGAGKTAVAHTVAQRCHENGLLACSFFFDRNTAGRCEPKKLFSTIARGLASFSRDIAEQIVPPSELDHSLATGPISRQFEELIRIPSLQYSGHKPIVIVIDALDEGYNIMLLSILRDHVPELHNKFRVFITSRPEEEIVAYLGNKAYILTTNIDIQSNVNLLDIAAYVKDRMQSVAYESVCIRAGLGHN